MLNLRTGDPVLDTDGRRGIIRDVYPHARLIKVAYPIGSPFLDDWTIFHPSELRPCPADPPPRPLSPWRAAALRRQQRRNGDSTD